MKRILISTSIFFIISFSIFAAIRYKPHVYPPKCVGCSDCIKVCPIKGAIELIDGKAVIYPDICNGCEKCMYICSYGAVW